MNRIHFKVCLLKVAMNSSKFEVRIHTYNLEEFLLFTMFLKKERNSNRILS